MGYSRRKTINSKRIVRTKKPPSCMVIIETDHDAIQKELDTGTLFADIAEEGIESIDAHRSFDGIKEVKKGGKKVAIKEPVIDYVSDSEDDEAKENQARRRKNDDLKVASQPAMNDSETRKLAEMNKEFEQFDESSLLIMNPNGERVKATDNGKFVLHEKQERKPFVIPSPPPGQMTQVRKSTICVVADKNTLRISLAPSHRQLVQRRHLIDHIKRNSCLNPVANQLEFENSFGLATAVEEHSKRNRHILMGTHVFQHSPISQPEPLRRSVAANAKKDEPTQPAISLRIDLDGLSVKTSKIADDDDDPNIDDHGTAQMDLEMGISHRSSTSTAMDSTESDRTSTNIDDLQVNEEVSPHTSSAHSSKSDAIDSDRSVVDSQDEPSTPTTSHPTRRTTRSMKPPVSLPHKSKVKPSRSCSDSPFFSNKNVNIRPRSRTRSGGNTPTNSAPKSDTSSVSKVSSKDTSQRKTADKTNPNFFVTPQHGHSLRKSMFDVTESSFNSPFVPRFSLNSDLNTPNGNLSMGRPMFCSTPIESNTPIQNPIGQKPKESLELPPDVSAVSPVVQPKKRRTGDKANDDKNDEPQSEIPNNTEDDLIMKVDEPQVAPIENVVDRFESDEDEDMESVEMPQLDSDVCKLAETLDRSIDIRRESTSQKVRNGVPVDPHTLNPSTVDQTIGVVVNQTTVDQTIGIVATDRTENLTIGIPERTLGMDNYENTLNVAEPSTFFDGARFDGKNSKLERTLGANASGLYRSDYTINQSNLNLTKKTNMSLINDTRDGPAFYLTGYNGNIGDGLAEMMHVIGQQKIENWRKGLPKDVFNSIEKLGEGAFGEVYKTTWNGESVAVKILPFTNHDGGYTGTVNDNDLKTPSELLPEILITRELSELHNLESAFSAPSFIRLKGAVVVKGHYPEEFLDAWDYFKKKHPKRTENQRPDEYSPSDQLFLCIALADGGTDIENFQIENEEELLSILLQMMTALAVAEVELEFEHRDLHDGNALVKKCDEDEVIEYRLSEKAFRLRSQGVKVSVIDFTNSRMSKCGTSIYLNLGDDEELFTQQGAYHTDIYRMMRDHNGNEWKNFRPKTNLFWMHYMTVQMLDKLKTRGKQKRIEAARKKELQALFERMFEFETIHNFMCDDEFFTAVVQPLVVE